jgi:hypothetical protein
MTVCRTTAAVSALLLALPLLSACQGVSFGTGQATLAPPQVPDRPRSLVCVSPDMQPVTPQALVYPWGSAGPAVPWYFVRNEAVLATDAGCLGPTSEQATTYVYDNQNSYNGRVYNDYTSQTYRVRTTQSQR